MEKLTTQDLEMLLAHLSASYIASFKNEAYLCYRKMYYVFRDELKSRVTEAEYQQFLVRLKEVIKQITGDRESTDEMMKDMLSIVKATADKF